MTTKSELLNIIRQNCIECSCGSKGEVRKCHLERCVMWPYRMGKDPTPARTKGAEKFNLQRNRFSQETAS